MDKKKTTNEILEERRIQAETDENLKIQIQNGCKILNGKWCQASLGGCKPLIHPTKHHCVFAIAYQRGINDAKSGNYGCSDDRLDTSAMMSWNQ